MRKQLRWERRRMPTKSESACDPNKNETRAFNSQSALFPPKDAALSQDTTNWLYLSIDQVVRRMSHYVIFQGKQNSLFAANIFF